MYSLLCSSRLSLRQSFFPPLLSVFLFLFLFLFCLISLPLPIRGQGQVIPPASVGSNGTNCTSANISVGATVNFATALGGARCTDAIEVPTAAVTSLTFLGGSATSSHLTVAIKQGGVGYSISGLAGNIENACVISALPNITTTLDITYYAFTDIYHVNSCSSLDPTVPNVCLSSDVTDAFTCTLSSPVAAYSEGLLVVLKPTICNTGAATLNVNGLGAVNIVTHAGGALSDCDIPANQPTSLRYNSTGPNWVIQGDGGAASPPSGGTGLSFWGPFWEGGAVQFTQAGANRGTWWPIYPVASFKQIVYKLTTAAAAGKGIILGVFVPDATTGAPTGSSLCTWVVTGTSAETTGYLPSGAPASGSLVAGGVCGVTPGGAYTLAVSSDDTAVAFGGPSTGVGVPIFNAVRVHSADAVTSAVSTGSGGALAFTSTAGWTAYQGIPSTWLPQMAPSN